MGEECWSPGFVDYPFSGLQYQYRIFTSGLSRLIPSWAKEPSVAARMINARLETAAAKPAFRDALKSRRCLIPADGFYEWARTAKAKQPYCFEVNEGELFAFAGLWDRWRDPSVNAVETCSILTTTPNAVSVAARSLLFDTLDTAVTGFVLASLRTVWHFDAKTIGVVSAIGLSGYLVGSAPDL